MTPPPMTPAEASAFVQEQVPVLLAYFAANEAAGQLIATTAARTLADQLCSGVAHTTGERSLLGHALILSSAALGVLTLRFEAHGIDPTSGRGASNVLALAGALLIDDATRADAEAGR
jgi:hypothetical protein